MQVTTPFAQSCPFLIESDILSLSSCIVITQNQIDDRRVGVSHAVSPEAMTILRLLESKASYWYVCRVTKKHCISDTQLSDLLGFLNTIGCLLVERRGSVRLRTLIWRGKYICLGIRFHSLVHRTPATLKHMFLAVIRSTAPVAIASIITSALIVGAQFMTLSMAATCVLWSLWVFTVSIWIHEVVHLIFILSEKIPVDILQSSLRIGLLHSPLPAQKEVLSAIAGPLSGVLFSLSAAAITHWLELFLFSMLACFIATFHIGSLLPWYGDGFSLRRALSTPREVL